jgi:hypothetical protein
MLSYAIHVFPGMQCWSGLLGTIKLSGFVHDFKNREKLGILLFDFFGYEKLGKLFVSWEKLRKSWCNKQNF